MRNGNEQITTDDICKIIASDSHVDTDIENLSGLILSALQSWGVIVTPQDIVILKPGYSGAVVLKIDCHAFTPHSTFSKSGRYILKAELRSTSSRRPTEVESNQLTSKIKSEFSDSHIPKIIESYELTTDCGNSNGTVYLCSIAGGRLEVYKTADSLRNQFSDVASKLSKNILEAWCLGPSEDTTSVSELLSSTVGHRLERPLLQERISEFFDGFKIKSAIAYGRTVTNPFFLIERGSTIPEQNFRNFTSWCHNDLHGGNILLNKLTPYQENFQIIDLAMASYGSALYDICYCEIGFLVSGPVENVKDSSLGMISEWLLKIDESELEGVPNKIYNTFAKNFSDIAYPLRKGSRDWLSACFPDRVEDFELTLISMRIAAALNWASKPISKEQARLAIAYAAHYTQRYLDIEIGQEKLASILSTESHSENNSRESRDAVESFFNDNADKNFILVHGASKVVSSLSVLNRIELDLIVDLTSGELQTDLQVILESGLRDSRPVHLLQDAAEYSWNAGRSVPWLRKISFEGAAGGDWLKGLRRSSFPRELRATLNKLTDAPDVLEIAILYIASDDYRIDEFILSCIDEAAGETYDCLLVGRARNAGIIDVKTAQNLQDLHSYIESLPAPLISDGIVVPTTNGPIELPPDVAASIKEYSELLHANVLDESASENSIFWKGLLPTWGDLNDNLDIAREVTSSLIEEVDEVIASGDHKIVIYKHLAGAGGSTILKRVAWSYRKKIPVLYVSILGDRLDTHIHDLYVQTRSPVLVAIDGDLATQSEVDSLARNVWSRNARVIFIRTQKVYISSIDSDEHSSGALSDSEANKFLKSYSAFIDDQDRLNDLKLITSSDAYARYRLPFFYGLIAFQREYVGLGNIVKQRWEGTSEPQKEIARLIALSTVYGSLGCPVKILAELAHVSPASFQVQDVLPEDFEQIIITENGHVRFLHPVLAELILESYYSVGPKQWIRYLSDACISIIELISDLKEKSVVLLLLKRIFILRDQSSEDDAHRDQFSRIIEDIDSVSEASGQRVFILLTEAFPKYAHFWTHLARHTTRRFDRDTEIAVQYVEKAIELEPTDPVHFHVLGYTYYRHIENLAQKHREADFETLFQLFQAPLDKAINAFRKSGSISTAQPSFLLDMIKAVSFSLKTLLLRSEKNSIVEIQEEHPLIYAKIASVLNDAEDWLEELSSNRFQGDEDDRAFRLRQQLSEVYGDYDSLIKAGELYELSGASSAQTRRALTNAYFNRSNRSILSLSHSERDRMITLCGKNIRTGKAVNGDFELWMRLAFHSNTVTITEIVEKADLWNEVGSGWKPVFYRSMIGVADAIAQEVTIPREIALDLQQLANMSVNLPPHSRYFLGKNDGPLPVIPSDIVELDRTSGRMNSSQKILRIDGTVQPGLKQSSAKVKIGSGIEAYFNPYSGKKQSLIAGRDEGRIVNFQLGFSPKGLRAWDVSVGSSNVTASKTTTAENVSLENRVVEREETAAILNIGGFIKTYLASLSQAVSLGELSDKLSEIFGPRFDKRYGVDESAFMRLLKGVDGVSIEDLDSSEDRRNALVGLVASSPDEIVTGIYGLVVYLKMQSNQWVYGKVNAGADSFNFRRKELTGKVPEKLKQYDTVLFEWRKKTDERLITSMVIIENGVWHKTNRFVTADRLRIELKNWFAEIIQQTQNQKFSEKELRDLIAEEYRSNKTLDHVLGYEFFKDFAKNILGLILGKKGLYEPATVGKGTVKSERMLANTVPDRPEVSEKKILEIVIKLLKLKTISHIQSLESALRNELSPKGLKGFKRKGLVELLKANDGIVVSKDNLLVRLNAKSERYDFDNESVVHYAEKVVSENNGAMTAPKLALILQKRFGKKFYIWIGFKSFSLFLNHAPNLEYNKGNDMVSMIS